MQKAIALLQNGWADWEAGYVLSGLRRTFGLEIATASPTGEPVVSIGGLEVSVDLSFNEILIEGDVTFLLIGSDAWIGFDDDLLRSKLLESFVRGANIGAICAATIFAAKAGLFEGRKHTSNDREFLQDHCGSYLGQDHYINSNTAVSDGRLVSAPGNAPLTFATSIFELIAPYKKEFIEKYQTFHAKETS